jgi:leucyl aminopeptidase
MGSMITVVATAARPRGVPHAFPVLEGPIPLGSGHGAVLARSRSGLRRQGFTGKLGQIAGVDGGDIAVGLGSEASVDRLRTAAGVLARSLGDLDRITSSLVEVGLAGAELAVVEGLILGGYQYSSYRGPNREIRVELVGAEPGEVERARTVAGAEVFARDLANTPAADKAPSELALQIARHAVEAGAEAEIWDEQKLAAEGLRGLTAVAAGSSRPPRLVRLSHRPRRSRGKLALVGKGIIFDSGGLSLKTAEAMEPMKTDMSGAAAVAGAVAAISRLKLPLGVEAFLPLTDNMPGGGALRPGDVIRYRNGKTIEVLNTDAEGRLVLADGLILAAEGAPDLIVDIATLTGAMRIALGNRIGGLFGSSEERVGQVRAAGAWAGERFWPMPLVEDYRALVDSEVADMKNTGGRYGGAIAAALILREFTSGVDWVHLDIAGPARAEQAYWWYPKGGTGFGARTLVALAEAMAGAR